MLQLLQNSSLPQKNNQSQNTTHKQQQQPIKLINLNFLDIVLQPCEWERRITLPWLTFSFTFFFQIESQVLSDLSFSRDSILLLLFIWYLFSFALAVVNVDY